MEPSLLSNFINFLPVNLPCLKKSSWTAPVFQRELKRTWKLIQPRTTEEESPKGAKTGKRWQTLSASSLWGQFIISAKFQWQQFLQKDMDSSSASYVLMYRGKVGLKGHFVQQLKYRRFQWKVDGQSVIKYFKSCFK